MRLVKYMGIRGSVVVEALCYKLKVACSIPNEVIEFPEFI
jgi:hypothetical protein